MPKDSEEKTIQPTADRPRPADRPTDALDAWADSMPFAAYSPYRTFSDSTNRVFVDHKGRTIHRNPTNPDSDALWKIGRDAFDLLRIKDHEDFLDRYDVFKSSIKWWRKFIEDIAESGKLFNHDRQRFDASALQLNKREASEILSIAWEILDQAANRGTVVRDESKAENFLFACLREIDNALIGMALDGRNR